MNQRTLRGGTWTELWEQAYAIRHEVFVIEQGVPVELEMDEMDPVAWHVLLSEAEGHPVATGRLLPDGHIGRVAVRAEWRGQGVGRELMSALLEAARERGHESAHIHAQTDARRFYELLGFVAAGEVFMEAGIPHIEMSKHL
jgi:predicted GNAT family N-acyltransferase